MKYVAFALLLSLAACKTGTVSNNDPALLVYAGEVQLKQIDDPIIYNQFKNALNNKTQVLLKKRPDFQYKIVMNSGSEQSAWLISNGSIVTNAADDSGIFYKVDFSTSLLNID